MAGQKIYQRLFTSESVGAGHPDKMCDQIADAILDACLKEDANSRTAIEVVAFKRTIFVCGEIKTHAKLNYREIVEKTIQPLGYTQDDFTIIISVNRQSLDIQASVDKKNGQIGAGDQGIKFGYASRETPEMMPLPIVIAHELLKTAEKLRQKKQFPHAKADMKSQVSIDYAQTPFKLDTVVISIQHEHNCDLKKFKQFIKEKIIWPVAKRYRLNTDCKMLINPAGKFTIGGTFADTGLTGRKIIVDTYGGKGRHGGGSFSGKDYTKMDRSGAYAARWIAKNIVAADLADEVETQISYAIGVNQPVSVSLETFGTHKEDPALILKAVKKVFDLSPSGIIEKLELRKPIYQSLATYGHFGRLDLKNLTWEKTDQVEKLKKVIKTLKRA